MISFYRFFRVIAALVAIPLSVLADDYRMELPENVTRPWIGAEFWSTALADWQLSNGRVETVHPANEHQVVLLTHQLKRTDGDLQMSVRLGSMQALPSGDGSFGSVGSVPGWAGFRFAVTGARPEDYRSALSGGQGISAGITTQGRLFVGQQISDRVVDPHHLNNLRLVLQAECLGDDAEVMLTVFAAESDTVLSVMTARVNKSPLFGNVAIACEPLALSVGGVPVGATVPQAALASDIRFWFDDWRITGSKVEAHAEQTWGPILWTQYTIHKNTVKLTAHFAPMGEKAGRETELLLADGKGGWKSAVREKIDPLSRTAEFRIDDWDSSRAVDYAVTYLDASWSGTLRSDPVDHPNVRMAVLSGMEDFAFPNRSIMQNVIAQDPDLVFFAGGQVGGSPGGAPFLRATTADEVPRATLGYLSNYWLFGWSFRDLLKDRPSVIIPDARDVFQGRLWGNGGKFSADQGAGGGEGGYRMHPTWINMVQRTQVSHLPDAYDPTPTESGIEVFYTDLHWGGVSFAILEDRKFKSPPDEIIVEPLIGSNGLDNRKAPNSGPLLLDKEGSAFLGNRQLAFLTDWATNWGYAEFKAVLSCSPFYALPTYHGGTVSADGSEKLAQLDSNGWPQTARARALSAIRKAHAIMIHGDKNLATLVQHGVEDWGDSSWSYAAPGIANNGPPSPSIARGEVFDDLGNKLSVWAMDDTSAGSTSGYGIITFDKAKLEITVESWPVVENFTGPATAAQMPGWPMTMRVDDMYARPPVAWLPTLRLVGVPEGEHPLIRVFDESDGSMVYARRVSETDFPLKVFALGSYTILVGEGRSDDKKFSGVVAKQQLGVDVLEVRW